MEELDTLGSPATVLNTGGRFFGFVIGGALTVALGANLMAVVWDQNAGLEVSSPVSACLENISRKWLNSLLHLPPETEAGFVTGATMALVRGYRLAKPDGHADQYFIMEDNQ